MTTILVTGANSGFLDKPSLAPNGIDRTFAANHLGHFALTLGLLNKYPHDLSCVGWAMSELKIKMLRSKLAHQIYRLMQIDRHHQRARPG